MRLITTRATCKCGTAHTVEVKAPGLFASFAPFTCKKCGSKSLAEIKRQGFFSKKILVRTKLISHTSTLLNILKRRGLRA